MVQFIAQRLMEMDVEERCGAGYDGKNPEQLNSRNGRARVVVNVSCLFVRNVEPGVEQPQ